MGVGMENALLCLGVLHHGLAGQVSKRTSFAKQVNQILPAPFHRSESGVARAFPTLLQSARAPKSNLTTSTLLLQHAFQSSFPAFADVILIGTCM